MTVDQLFEVVRREAQGAYNRERAREALGHEPDSLEALNHFLEHGGEEYVKRLLSQLFDRTNASNA